MDQEPVQLIQDKLLQDTLALAKASPRQRMNFNFHASMDENPHRFLNVMLVGTYIQPHRHLEPPKSESFLILEGRAAFFCFDEHGRIEATHILDGQGGQFARGIDIAPGVWHTLHVVSEYVYCFEVKPGPYTRASDKEFASWAPRENEAGWQEYQKMLAASID